LNTATRAPAATSERAITAATTVFPTWVPVPVTKKPRTYARVSRKPPLTGI
jgi:hypothetical protein